MIFADSLSRVEIPDLANAQIQILSLGQALTTRTGLLHNGNYRAALGPFAQLRSLPGGFCAPAARKFSFFRLCERQIAKNLLCVKFWQSTPHPPGGIGSTGKRLNGRPVNTLTKSTCKRLNKIIRTYVSPFRIRVSPMGPLPLH